MTTPMLEGRTALITGASRGLGRALCEAFARHGARVAFTWTRDEAGALATREALRAAGALARDYRVSVLDSPGTAAMLKDLEGTLGPVDILVNNAGATQNLPLALLEEEDYDRVMDVNVKGAFLTAKAALRGMLRRKRGVVLNLGSLAGERMLDAPIHYCTSKAALRGMTESLAREVARYGLRVLCLAPGLLEDGLGRNLPEHRLNDYLHHCALGRVGTFREVAEFAAFLVSDMNSYMTGETIVMDGGV
ncbi:MAG: SDR family oxidoreductase [Deltaproteobacteria bacterium]|nr:SDR family oxidoreductase [Deltaproteobacteria bacterium]